MVFHYKIIMLKLYRPSLYIYITFICFCFIDTYNMSSPIHVHVYVCSIVYMCKYCVCPHGPYGLLDFEIKLYLLYQV